MNLRMQIPRVPLALSDRQSVEPFESRPFNRESGTLVHFTPKFAPGLKNLHETIRFDFSFPAR